MTGAEAMISVVVNIFNMRREAARTLYSLSSFYQRNILPSEYEVIVVENGSTDPIGEEAVESYGKNFRYVDMGSRAHPSPVVAVNRAVAGANGDMVGLILDGARMVSPRLLANARDSLKIGARVVACTLAWHLGDEHQSLSVKKGYSQQKEDLLLAALDWKRDGYRLLKCAAWAFSNPIGHFGYLAESCATFMSKALFEALGGYNENFELPGGGYANLDFFKRCCEVERAKVVLLAGEGTFHQYHGGATTGQFAEDYGVKAAEEYRRIVGCDYMPPKISPIFFGMIDSRMLPWLNKSLEILNQNQQEFSS